MAGAKFKPQFQRLVFIDKKIREGGFPSCATLGQEREVSAKTIQRDIDYLKDLGAPIEYDETRHGLYYRDKSWFLPSVLLNESDILALLIGYKALGLYKGTPIAGELQEIYQKLVRVLPDSSPITPEVLFSRFSFHSAPFRSVNPDIWKTVLQGLLNQQAIQIRYMHRRAHAPSVYTVHPLHMANIEGEWFVLGLETGSREIAQYAVFRIIRAELLSAKFEIPEDFDAERLMEDRFGKFIHVKGGRRTIIQLRFKAELATSIAERIWHPKQKIKWRKDGQLELSFPVVDIRDVAPWIRSLGSGVKVIKPKMDMRRHARALISTSP